MSIKWKDFFSFISQRAKPSSIRELMQYSGDPSFISFGGGYPSPKTFPDEEIKDIVSSVKKEEICNALQYSNSPGIPQLLEIIKDIMKDETEKEFNLENILVTNGSQEGLFLSALNFINQSNTIIVEEPTYLTAILPFDLVRANYFTIPLESDGMNVNQLEKLLQSKKLDKTVNIKFIYTIPTFQNPGGATMSLEKRMKLLEVGKEYGIPIIEDSPYEKLRFEGKHLPTLKKLDDDVIALRTFSKTLCPGFRIGWVIAPEDVIRKFVTIRQSIDLHSSTFSQYVIYKLIEKWGIKGYNKRLEKNAQLYRTQKDAMIAALKNNVPILNLLSEPQGGLFLWGMLPPEFNVDDMKPYLIENKILVIPGEDFSALHQSKNCIRLSYSLPTVEQMEEGTKRLYATIQQYAKDKKIKL